MRDLSKKKLGQVSKAIDEAQGVFRAVIEQIAEEARAEILPYFKKHGFSFTAGNGTWSISKPAADADDYYKPENYVDDDELPDNICALLNLEIAHNDYLGFYIRDIKRGEW